MSQSRRGSMVEALANVAVGLVLSLGLQTALSEWYGLRTSLAVDVQIVILFTGLSLMRGYVLRRVFEGWRG